MSVSGVEQTVRPSAFRRREVLIRNYSMSEPEPKETEVSQLPWPENGGQWSDGEDGDDKADMEDRADMEDCGLLQEMTEEDEDFDLYNEETFGMDVEEKGSGPPSELLQFEPLPSSPVPPAMQVSPPSSDSSPSPPRQRPPFRSPGPPVQRGNGRGRGQRGPGQSRGQRGAAQSRGQMFEDPAVMRTVERSSFKNIDSSIVDYEVASSWNVFDQDAWMFPSKTRRTSGSMLQDNAIVCVIGGRGHYTNSSFLDSAYHCPASRGRRAPPRGQYCSTPFSQRGPIPMMPNATILSHRPFNSQQHYNQTEGFLSPSSRPCPSPPQSLTPKMMQLRFGANSPRPSPVYSPSSNPVQRFRYPASPITQLHPQHRRVLSQRRHTSPRKSQSWDPYCDLMSSKEKDWITRLQMIQLQSENPYLDDYYYQEYYRRMEAKQAEEELVIRNKREPPKLTTPYVTKTDSYTPVVHIEGSLGQVAVSTCYSPRRAIGAVHAAQAQCPHEEQKDVRQQRLEVLKKIEKLFVVLLEVEEAERMKTTAVNEAEERRLMKKSQRKVEHIYAQLQHPEPLESGEEFLPCLLVSKGKRLLARLIPFLDHDCGLNVLHVVTSHLPMLMSRDTDESLPVLYPSLRTLIGGLSFNQLIRFLKHLTVTEPDSRDSRCLSLACQNKFGLSLLYALLSQGEKLLSSDVPLEPGIGDFETWTDTIFQVAWQLSQSSLVEPLLLPPNLLTLFCRYLDKRTVHKLKSNIESATGTVALPS